VRQGSQTEIYPSLLSLGVDPLLMGNKGGIRFQQHTSLDMNKITANMNGTAHFCVSYVNINLDHIIVITIKQNLY
jgi:hypothetical protein